MCAGGRTPEWSADGRQAALSVPLRSVVYEVLAKVQVGSPHGGDLCALALSLLPSSRFNSEHQ